MNKLHQAIMKSAIDRMIEANEKLAVALSDLRLIRSGKKENGDETDRLLAEIEKVKLTLADVLTLAVNRDVFDSKE